eukprot:CAMPEP_0172587118 /NCGR_PEP_ID=MMETSP1068-20121228/6239_1 /TAXON_ID=35684 /ORGANISM="Pseudopedinella elastica, Strain CCMP716" /LENGTH=122 /DNA_ID=CAMNT_0013382039 /DNA_START=287 /DNA_END=651 /DNA_ORIENTATION=-
MGRGFQSVAGSHPLGPGLGPGLGLEDLEVDSAVPIHQLTLRFASGAQCLFVLPALLLVPRLGQLEELLQKMPPPLALLKSAEVLDRPPHLHLVQVEAAGDHPETHTLVERHFSPPLPGGPSP